MELLTDNIDYLIYGLLCFCVLFGTFTIFYKHHKNPFGIYDKFNDIHIVTEADFDEYMQSWTYTMYRRVKEKMYHYEYNKRTGFLIEYDMKTRVFRRQTYGADLKAALKNQDLSINLDRAFFG